MIFYLLLIDSQCFGLIDNISSSGNFNKKDHVVAFVFAGRKQYLSLQMTYLDRLLERRVLHEVHLWQYTKDEDDIKYLESISNVHKTSSNFFEYRTIYPLIEDNSFKLNVKAKSDAHILVNNKYEIVIGGWENTVSVMRYSGENKVKFPEKGILDENKFREFVVKLKNNTLSVNHFMSLKVDDNEIESISIHTGFGSEGYWDYEETRNKNVKLFDTKKRNLWHEMDETYDFYLDYNFDVVLKIDDDVVYMDLDRYDEFVSFIKNNPKKMGVFPNIINHAVCLFYNNKNGLVPDTTLNEKFVNKPLTWEYVVDYYYDGSQATKLHEYFLSNVGVFTKNNMSPICLDEHRESICMFGILKKNYDIMFDRKFKVKLKKNDERYVYKKKGNILYPRFVVVHYQFSAQMKSGLDTRFLSEYENLSQDRKEKQIKEIKTSKENKKKQDL